MRSSNAIASCDSNSAVRSYLVELRNIAINFQALSSTTSTRLKKAAILIGSRRVRRQKSEKAIDLVDGDKEGWDLEYDLLTPNQIAIADDMITLQQFGEDIFCAPQEEILEGKYRSTARLLHST